MGIISDTFEDNAELAGQRFASDLIHHRDFSGAVEYIQVEKCPFCFRAFPISDLNNHYQNSHRTEHCYIRLNGTIVREIGWAEKGIKTMEVGLLGYDEVEVNIKCGTNTQSFRINRNLDVLSCVPSNFEGEIFIEIKPNSSAGKKFIIYCKSIPEFRRNDIDSLIITLQNELEAATNSLDLGKWKSKFKEFPDVNVLEKRYFSGFYEYALGSFLEKNNKYKEAKQHFEDAFGLLLPFNTILAQTAFRILGFKMNCFAFFEGCLHSSPFAPADAFFNKAMNPNESSFIRAEPSDLGIFIDRFSQLFLDTLYCFYNDPEDELPILLDALQRDHLSKERNNEVKLYLLKARYYKYSGQINKAMEAYSSDHLHYHPIFGEESKLFIECQTKIQ